jgi:PAS domain S-box-containing protein
MGISPGEKRTNNHNFCDMTSKENNNSELARALELLKLEYKSKCESCQNEIRDLRDSLEKVRKSEEKFRKVYLTSPDSININRLSDGMYVSINDGFTNIMGFNEEDVIGKTSIGINIWNNPEDRNALVRALGLTGKIKNFEAQFVNKSGKIINGLMSASLIDLDGVSHILSVTRDISIRKKAEEELEQEKHLIEAIMNNFPEHIYFKDRESHFIRINKSHATSFGLNDPSLVIGKTDFDFFTEEHARQAFDDEQEIIQSGHPFSKEEKLTWKNKPDTWSLTTKLPLINKEGKIIGTFGISRDITERKKTEEQLFLLANALKSINEAVSITDMEDKVLFLNRAFLDTYGFSEDELTEKQISAIRSPNNPSEVVNEILPSTLKGGWHGEIFNRKKDGTEFLISLSTAAVKDTDEKPIALIGVASDITERKRTELENQILYEITKGVTTTSNLDELLYLIHRSLGKVVYAENCFVALHNPETGLFSFPYFIDKFDTTPSPMSMGKSCTAYVFRSVTPFLFSQKLFDDLMEKAEVELVGYPSPSWIGVPLQTPSSVIGVLVLQHYENENVYTEKDLKFLTSIGSQLAITIERKKTEEEIIFKNHLLQTTNAEKDKFFSILAHDLRGPLSSFVDAIQIITEQIQTMEKEEIWDITMSMKSSATNIYSLLENLLEWSRLKRGGMDFLPEKINLNKKINSAIEVLAESARKKEIEIIVSVSSGLRILADNHMFETVIRNLVSNAIKFTKNGGKVTVKADKRSDNSIEIHIIDSGIGMTPELKNKLFQINEKTSRPGTEGEASTGLGLLLCKEFIEKNGGKIFAESEVGKGSTFSVIIPSEIGI